MSIALRSYALIVHIPTDELLFFCASVEALCESKISCERRFFPSIFSAFCGLPTRILVKTTTKRALLFLFISCSTRTLQCNVYCCQVIHGKE